MTTAAAPATTRTATVATSRPSQGWNAWARTAAAVPPSVHETPVTRDANSRSVSSSEPEGAQQHQAEDRAERGAQRGQDHRRAGQHAPARQRREQQPRRVRGRHRHGPEPAREDQHAGQQQRDQGQARARPRRVDAGGHRRHRPADRRGREDHQQSQGEQGDVPVGPGAATAVPGPYERPDLRHPVHAAASRAMCRASSANRGSCVTMTTVPPSSA
ncbi:hypothetical protein HFP72_02210 [Nocardiopsis sp. ARC36]